MKLKRLSIIALALPMLLCSCSNEPKEEKAVWKDDATSITLWCSVGTFSYTEYNKSLSNNANHFFGYIDQGEDIWIKAGYGNYSRIDHYHGWQYLIKLKADAL